MTKEEVEINTTLSIKSAVEQLLNPETMDEDKDYHLDTINYANDMRRAAELEILNPNDFK